MDDELGRRAEEKKPEVEPGNLQNRELVGFFQQEPGESEEDFDRRIVEAFSALDEMGDS